MSEPVLYLRTSSRSEGASSTLSWPSAWAAVKDLVRSVEPRTKRACRPSTLIASNDKVVCWPAMSVVKVCQIGVQYAEQTATRRYDPELDGQVGCICL